jgi:hypothetical protein
MSLRDASRSVEDAQQRVNDTTEEASDLARDRRGAELDLVDAQRQLLEIQERIADLPRERAGAQLDVREANLSIVEAEERLNEARAEGDSQEIERAEIGLERARIRAADAQDNLNDAEQKGADLALDMQRANLRVEEAHDAVSDATDRATGLALDQVRAREDLETAMYNEAQAAAAVAVAQAILADANTSAETKARLQIDALQVLANTLAPDSPLRAQLQQYIDGLNAIPPTKSTTIHTAYTWEGLEALIPGVTQDHSLVVPYLPPLPMGASGGIVPGSLGQPFPMIAHGQELILNPGQQQQYGVGPYANLTAAPPGITAGFDYDRMAGVLGDRALVGQVTINPGGDARQSMVELGRQLRREKIRMGV